jgi:putative Ca2+/H+ antiporter (TMEM165/GDT1 family)
MEALLVSTSVVALAEMGDKTQLATVALAARYDPLVAVVMGTTLGMMIAPTSPRFGWAKRSPTA